ncbi:unnamed protein product, partial [Porites evermanni]
MSVCWVELTGILFYILIVMALIAKNSTIFAKVRGKGIMIVEIGVKPTRINKANSYRWFTDEHFSRLILKLEDVILARVLAPLETNKVKKSGKSLVRDNADILPDPELLIQYYFVRRRQSKQIALCLSKQKSLLDGGRKNTQKADYSGGGYQRVNIFPEKIKVTVSQIDLDPTTSVQGLAQDIAKKGPSKKKSSISKYFEKGTAEMTPSTQKGRAALKNLNKKQDPQKKVSPFLSVTSDNDCSSMKERGETDRKESERAKYHDQITWVNRCGEVESQENLAAELVVASKNVQQQPVLTSEGSSKTRNSSSGDFVEVEIKERAKQLDEKRDIKDSLPCQDIVNLKETKHECGNSTPVQNPSGNFSKSGEFELTDNEENKTVNDMTKQGTVTVVSDKVDSLKSSSSITANLKRPRSNSLRLSLNGGRNASANRFFHNDFETPKAKRNAEKRTGSDLSDDQGVCSSMSTCEQSGSSTSVEKELSYKTRKASRANMTSEASLKSHTSKPVKKKLKKRQVTTSSKATSDILEDEEPGSSPLEPITIEDRPPVVLNVSTIEELTEDQTEQLVWEFSSEIREIFEGKRFSRRHEDYKKGGRMKGDLAFQVQFGQFSEEQRDRIMEVLTAMFCYKHSKYFDYVSKVLLPETLVMIYMKVMGRTHNEVRI